MPPLKVLMIWPVAGFAWLIYYEGEPWSLECVGALAAIIGSYFAYAMYHMWLVEYPEFCAQKEAAQLAARREEELHQARLERERGGRVVIDAELLDDPPPRQVKSLPAPKPRW